jgi:hypothetical protein
VISAALVFTKDIGVGGFRWGDTPSHAMDGVLIHDWLAGGPEAWVRPVAFAERQYAHYPTLSIGRTYPPGFAIFEALFFALLGVSAGVARLTTACFGVAAVAGAYLVGGRFLSRVGAVCAAVALLTMPMVVLWTRQTMLEMPTLAVLIWLTYAVQMYLAKPTWLRCSAVVILLLASCLFKQTAVFIVPVVGVIMVVQAWRRVIPWRQFIVSSVAVGVPVAGMFVLTLQSGGCATHLLEVVTQGNGVSGWATWASLRYYPAALRGQIGSLLVAAAIAGFVVSMRRFDWDWGLMLLWFASLMVMLTFIQHKEPRYLFFACFPIAMWAGLAVDRVFGMFRRKLVPGAVLACASTWLLAQAYVQPIGYRPDYGELVAANADKIRGRIVFFEGRRDGDFIFAVRARLGPRRAVIVRGSKILYSCAADTRWRYESYVRDEAEVGEALDRFGFSALFVEREPVTNAAEIGLLQAYLASTSTYGRVGSRVLTAGGIGQACTSRAVDVYVPQTPIERTARFVEIPLPIASQSIRVDLDALMAELEARLQAG